MLAAKYDGAKMDPTGWWISEKLDGVRAYWDGKNFYSRNGNPFPAPQWFKDGLPSDMALDGELWAGRGMFRRCLSIVRNGGSGDLWEYVTYLVFDIPPRTKKDGSVPYEDRLETIRNTIVPIAKNPRGNDGNSDAKMANVASVGTPYAAPVESILCKSRAHLQEELDKVDANGGEGLMLRQPGSLYEEGKRSSTLLKVKTTHDEEAQVMAHEPGKGRNSGRLGALTLETPDGRQFSCGTGLTDKDRDKPPAIGSLVTYRYTELMDNSYPRFPVCIAERTDLD